MAETLPENDPGRGQAARGDPSAIGDPAQAQLPAHQRPSALIIAWALALIGLSLFYSGLRIGWALLGDGVFNRHTADRPAAISETERRRWAASVVMDWHADSLLWNRSLTAPSDEGHWDLPRARQGGLDLQMLTIVSDVREPIGLLALAQGWPLRTVWDPAARIDYQIDRFHRLVERAADEIVHVHDRASLERAMSGDAVGLLLGLEGIHGIEDRPEAIDEWFALGVRMASVVHRHDNHYGSSSGGSNRTGPDAMTEGGRSMLRRMRELGMILDLSHAAPGFIDEALGIYEGGPIVASHTGFQRHCDRPRNLSAEHSRGDRRQRRLGGGDVRAVDAVRRPG